MRERRTRHPGLCSPRGEDGKANYTRRIDVNSNRAGEHPGTHEIGFDLGSDTITLRHVTRNRECYARGALRAARWVAGKKGLFDFRNIFDQLE